MGTTKQQQRQTKREKKAQKEAARKAARKAEQRRNRITFAVVAVIVLAGGGLALNSVLEDRREQAAAEAEQEALMADLEAEQEALESRDVACGADEPDQADEEKPTYDEPGQVIEAGVDYRAVIETSCGELVMELHADAAPETVNAFVFLVEEGFYDGLEIFRIAESIAALQTGAGNNDNSWEIGYTLPDETSLAEDEGYPIGSVAMAKSAEPDTAGSQFFFVYGDEFDEVHGDAAEYTRFADVVDGVEVLEEMGEIGAAGEMMGAEMPAELLYMESVRIEAG